MADLECQRGTCNNIVFAAQVCVQNRERGTGNGEQETGNRKLGGEVDTVAVSLALVNQHHLLTLFIFHN